MIDQDDVLLIVRLGDEAGGRVDPERIMRRRPESAARQAFHEAVRQGLLDSAGWLTPLAADVLDQETNQ